jgi:hypothetical protein
MNSAFERRSAGVRYVRANRQARTSRDVAQFALPRQTPFPARRFTRHQPIHRLVRKRVDALVTELAGVTAHPLPLDVV